MTKIAIIDDDIYIGDMLTEVLTQEGYSVLRAYSGTEALYLLSQNKPDLVLDMVSLSLTVQGQAVKLTRTEYAILKLLMENPKQVIAKSVLLDRISMDTPDCTERSLKQHISNALKYSDGDFAVVMDETGCITFINTAQNLNAVSVGRLFDRFYTVEASRYSTGLELYFIKATHLFHA